MVHLCRQGRWRKPARTDGGRLPCRHVRHTRIVRAQLTNFGHNELEMEGALKGSGISGIYLRRSVSNT